MSGRSLPLAATIFGALLLYSPRPALAAWFQWGTEGSYVHQTAHFLFAMAMLFFLYEMHQGGLSTFQGFRRLRWACWLLVVWNLDAIAGHSLEWALLNPVIMGQGLGQRLLMEDLHTWAYYFTRFTHYSLLPPAFYLFYRGVKEFAQETRSRSK
ncbi:MAG: hypothetical protein FJ128_08230 [Deltaproteobacteria bacterium]|nr:hypothetical protein [Deltaproteobacteria bacterium]